MTVAHPLASVCVCVCSVSSHPEKTSRPAVLACCFSKDQLKHALQQPFLSRRPLRVPGGSCSSYFHVTSVYTGETGMCWPVGPTGIGLVLVNVLGWGHCKYCQLTLHSMRIKGVAKEPLGPSLPRMENPGALKTFLGVASSFCQSFFSIQGSHFWSLHESSQSFWPCSGCQLLGLSLGVLGGPHGGCASGGRIDKVRGRFSRPSGMPGGGGAHSSRQVPLQGVARLG